MDRRHYRLVIKLTMKGKGINETVIYDPSMSSKTNKRGVGIYINTTKKLNMDELISIQRDKIQEIKDNDSKPVPKELTDTFIKNYTLISGNKDNKIFRKTKGGRFGSLIPGSSPSFFGNELGNLISAPASNIKNNNDLYKKSINLMPTITIEDGINTFTIGISDKTTLATIPNKIYTVYQLKDAVNTALHKVNKNITCSSIILPTDEKSPYKVKFTNKSSIDITLSGEFIDYLFDEDPITIDEDSEPIEIDDESFNDSATTTALDILNHNIEFICNIIFKPFSTLLYNGKIYKINPIGNVGGRISKKLFTRKNRHLFDKDVSIKYFDTMERDALKSIGDDTVLLINHINVNVSEVDKEQGIYSGCDDKRNDIYKMINQVFPGLLERATRSKATIDNIDIDTIVAGMDAPKDQYGGRIKKSMKRKYTKHKKRRSTKKMKYGRNTLWVKH